MQVRLVALVAFVLGTALPTAAHHSFSGEFDVNKPIKLEGTVTKVEWINPHAWIHIDVKRPDGTVESWAIEGGTPNTLMRRGFTKDSLKTGTAIAVDGYLARDGSRRANGRDVTLPDGRKLFMGSQGQGGPPQ
jgi:DNA/RNA endonuclease YhcR with UshA esterase domain